MRPISPQRMVILWLLIKNTIRPMFTIIKSKPIRPARTLRKRIGASNPQNLQSIQVNRISLVSCPKNRMFFQKSMNKALKMSMKIRKELIRSLPNVKQQLQNGRKAHRSQKLQPIWRKKSLLRKKRNKVRNWCSTFAKNNYVKNRKCCKQQNEQFKPKTI